MTAAAIEKGMFVKYHRYFKNSSNLKKCSKFEIKTSCFKLTALKTNYFWRTYLYSIRHDNRAIIKWWIGYFNFRTLINFGVFLYTRSVLVFQNKEVKG